MYEIFQVLFNFTEHPYFVTNIFLKIADLWQI